MLGALARAPASVADLRKQDGRGWELDVHLFYGISLWASDVGADRRVQRIAARVVDAVWRGGHPGAALAGEIVTARALVDAEILDVGKEGDVEAIAAARPGAVPPGQGELAVIVRQVHRHRRTEL